MLSEPTYLKDAEDACMKQFSYLPLPTNQKENDDYLKAFQTFKIEITYYGVSAVALGLSDKDIEGTFVKIGRVIQAEYSNDINVTRFCLDDQKKAKQKEKAPCLAGQTGM